MKTRFLLFAAVFLTCVASLSGSEAQTRSSNAGFGHYPGDVDAALEIDFTNGKALFLAAQTVSLSIVGVDLSEWKIAFDWGYEVVLTRDVKFVSVEETLNKYKWCGEYNRKLLDRIPREKPKK